MDQEEIVKHCTFVKKKYTLEDEAWCSTQNH